VCKVRGSGQFQELSHITKPNRRKILDFIEYNDKLITEAMSILWALRSSGEYSVKSVDANIRSTKEQRDNNNVMKGRILSIGLCD
jgi:hypothetical protein